MRTRAPRRTGCASRPPPRPVGEGIRYLVVFAQHGWWQACDELGLPGYPPYGPDSANLNLVLRQTPSDPISGSAPLRASVCDVAPLDTAGTG